jgi:hypothetical protein
MRYVRPSCGATQPRLIRRSIAELLADLQRMAVQCLRALPGVDRQQVYQYVSRNPIGHQCGKSGLQLVQLRGRPAVRWPTDTGLGTTAASTQKPGKPYPHLAEQRCNPVRPTVFHMASPAAGLAVRPQDRVIVSLCGNDILLNSRQQLLRFGQRQTQVGEIAKTIRSADLHHVETSGLTIDPRSDQPQHPFHPRTPSRQHTRPVVSP